MSSKRIWKELNDTYQTRVASCRQGELLVKIVVLVQQIYRASNRYELMNSVHGSRWCKLESEESLVNKTKLGTEATCICQTTSVTGTKQLLLQTYIGSSGETTVTKRQTSRLLPRRMFGYMLTICRATSALQCCNTSIHVLQECWYRFIYL